MNETLSGVAHVSFTGAGFFVPAGTSAERRALIEQLAAYSRMETRVQVLAEGKRWFVRRTGNRSSSVCATCDATIKTALCWLPGDEAPYCLRCAFDEGPAPSDPAHHRAALPHTTPAYTEYPKGRDPHFRAA